MTDEQLLSQYAELSAKAFIDPDTLRRGHAEPLAYSYYHFRRAQLMGEPINQDESALAALNKFRALHGDRLNSLYGYAKAA